jgi:hypothetical protein
MPHPELYARLLHWRHETAEEHDMEPRKVLRTRSLRDLVEILPPDIASLKGINRIGNLTVQRFGAALVGMISEYRAKHNIKSKEPTPLDSAPRPPKTGTRVASFDLYKSGKTIEEIAAERGLKTNTIEGHLAHFIGRGALDISDFLAKEQVDEIARFFKDHNTVSTAQAKAHFGEEYSYGELGMVLEYLKTLKE